MTHIISDIVIFDGGITNRGSIKIYSAAISIYSTISNCETFSIIEVNAITTIVDACDILKIQVWTVSINSFSTRTLNSKVGNRRTCSYTSKINPVSATVYDRIILYCHHTACSSYIDINPITRTSGIVAHQVIFDSGTFSFYKIYN